jgi:hypothetical protein
LPLSATSDKETKSSCTVYIESPGGTKSSNVNTCVKPQITCTANSIFCGTSGGADVIKQCSSDGATTSIKEICQPNFYCDATTGTPKCVEGNGGSKCAWYNIPCQINKWISSILSGINWTLVIISLIAMIIIVIGLIVGFRKLTK